MPRYQAHQNITVFSDGAYFRLPVCEIYSLSVTEHQPLLVYDFPDDPAYQAAAQEYFTAELSFNRLVDTLDVSILWGDVQMTAAEFFYYFYAFHTRETLPYWFPERLREWRASRPGAILPFLHPHPFTRRDTAWRFEVGGNLLSQAFNRENYLEIWNTTFRLRSMVLPPQVFTDTADNPNTI